MQYVQKRPMKNQVRHQFDEKGSIAIAQNMLSDLFTCSGEWHKKNPEKWSGHTAKNIRMINHENQT